METELLTVAQAAARLAPSIAWANGAAQVAPGRTEATENLGQTDALDDSSADCCAFPCGST